MPSDDHFEECRFKTIEDFKWAMKCHNEVAFEWKDKDYIITHSYGTINICETHPEKILRNIKLQTRL